MVRASGRYEIHQSYQRYETLAIMMGVNFKAYLLYQDTLSMQDECVVVPLYLVCATIGRQGGRGGAGKCYRIACCTPNVERDNTRKTGQRERVGESVRKDEDKAEYDRHENEG
jgi:hypothetical protein